MLTPGSRGLSLHIPIESFPNWWYSKSHSTFPHFPPAKSMCRDLACLVFASFSARFPLRWLMALLFLVSGAPAMAQTQAPKLNPEEQAKLDRLTSDLFQDDFAQRQRAMRELFEMGIHGVEPAITATLSPDREARQRGEQLLTQFTLTNVSGSRVFIRKRLNEIAESDPDLAPLANKTSKLLQTMSVKAAKIDMERAGGTIRDSRDLDETTVGPFNVTLGKSWKGGDESFKAIADLENVNFLSIDNAPLTDKSIESINKLRTLNTLAIYGTLLTENGITQLDPKLRLRVLVIRGLPFGDSGMAKLPEFQDLLLLDLSFTKVTDAGMQHIKRYPNLKRLWLQQTEITSASMPHVAQLQDLEELQLNGTKVTGPELGSLKVLPQLSKIEFKACRLEPATLSYLAGFPTLTSLNLDGTNVTDAQIADLALIPNLRELQLARTKITDLSVPHLKKLQKLENLYLHGTGISQPLEQELRKALPNCQIRS